MFIQLFNPAVQFPCLGSKGENPYCEEGEDTGEQAQGDTGEKSSCPRITSAKLIETIERPCSIYDKDDADNGGEEDAPEIFTEVFHAFGEVTAESPEFENEFDG